MQQIQYLFNLLPDITGYLFAMAGIGLMFVPDEMKKLDDHRSLRLGIAVVVILLGFGAVVSNSYQKSRDKEDAKQERDALNGQIISLRDELTITSEELSIAKHDLSGQLSKTEGTLAENINQYRSDTKTAIGRMLVPPRTLGNKRNELISKLKSIGHHTLVLHLATRGNREAIDFANEIESAFKDSGWDVERPNGIIFSDTIGFQIHVKSLTELRPTQYAVAKAFTDLGIQLTGGIDSKMTNEDIVEINVGLQ